MSASAVFNLTGLAGSFIISFGLVPQVAKVYETKSAVDFSYSFLGMYSLGLGMTVLYGIGEALWPIYIPCSMEFLGALLLLIMKLVYDNRPENEERRRLLSNAADGTLARERCKACNCNCGGVGIPATASSASSP